MKLCNLRFPLQLITWITTSLSLVWVSASACVPLKTRPAKVHVSRGDALDETKAEQGLGQETLDSEGSSSTGSDPEPSSGGKKPSTHIGRENEGENENPTNGGSGTGEKETGIDKDNSSMVPPKSGENGTGDKPVKIEVPVSTKVVYRPLGLGKGGYASIKEAKWPDKCVKGDIVPTTGPLFPFNEAQTLVVRGPLELSELLVFGREGSSWKRLGDVGDLKWEENNFGTIKSLGTYPLRGKGLENGRELFSHLPASGEKIIIAKLKMPLPTTGPINSNAQNDVPALWLLNSKIFKAPSSQYFCNCRGLGNPGGCGELDIAEIIPENKTEITTTIYTYEGAKGGILSKPRPSKNYQIYAAVLRSEGTQGEVSVLEVDDFDFGLKELPDSFVSKEWLPSAKPLNKNSEALNPPPR